MVSPKAVPSIKLNNGVLMPQLGLGVFKTQEGEEVRNAVRWAIEAGYRHIDTASLYENEQGVGEAIRESGVPREEIFVTTKVWNTEQGYDQTLKAFDASLKRLGSDYVDLYLVHWPGRDKYIETYKALEKLLADGYVRAIGVSNFKEHHLEKLMAETNVVPVVNQVECHPRLQQTALLEYCTSKGIVLEAWAPLMKGDLDRPVLVRIAEKYGKTPAQVVLRWNVQRGVIVIPKSVRKERIESNADIFDFELTAEEMAEIAAMDENFRYGKDPDEFLF
jgi:diketogulonate reductase-like aldo/keto reductase